MNRTPAISRFIEYFGELGPRWGLGSDTCRVHAFLYLAGAAVSRKQIIDALSLSDIQANEALEDLAQWGMARRNADGSWDGSGEPWDLLFAALEERRRRELQPALDMLRQCQKEVALDGVTPLALRARITRLLSLVEDLAAIDLQSRRLSSNTLSRLVTIGGRTARMLDRLLPSTKNHKP
jgi:DNA-binding transcriptional regulator GbsR (MarR family)